MRALWYESLFPVLDELGIGFVAFSPLANGFLTGVYDSSSKFDSHTDYRASMPQFQKDSYEQNSQLIELIENLAEQKHATPSQISLAWMLNKRPWIVPIPGTRQLYRLKENIGATDINLTKEELNAIDDKLDSIPMSQVFGGSKIISTPKDEVK